MQKFQQVTLDRATDSDSDAEVSAGNFTFIEEGAVNADAGFVLQGPDPLTTGSGGTDMNWVLFSTSSDIIAGTGLLKTGNVIDLDFSQLTSASVIAVADELIFQDAGVESRITVTNFLADRDIVTATANGMLARTANDTYASRTLTASAVAGDEGISIVNGNGVSGNPTIGLDILGQTNLVTDSVDDADELILYHSIAGGSEGLGNYAVTASKLKTYMNAGTSATSISELDSILAVSDSGTDGTLTWTADNVIQFTVDDTTFAIVDGLDITMATGSTITVADLTNNDVMIVGTAGLIEDSGGNLTFSGSELAVTGSLKSSLLTDNDVLIAGASGIVEDSGGNLTFNGTTFAVTGAATVSTDLTVGESVYVTQQAAAGGDTAQDGQIWVRDDAPNTLMFTDDVGNDFTANNVLEIEYEYSSATTTTDPGPGILNFNSITIGSITTLYIDDTDNTGRINDFLFDALSVGDVLTFRSASDDTDYILASVSSVTDSTGWWTIGLTLINTGLIFTNGDPIRIGVEWQSQGVSAVPTLITVADSSNATASIAFFESPTGDLGPKTDSQLTYNATTGVVTANVFSGDLTIDGSAFVTVDTAGQFTDDDVTLMTAAAVNDRIESFGYSTTVGTITGTVADNQVAIGTGASSLDSSANLTFNGTTLTVAGVLIIDEITIDGDTISNNTTDQPLILNPNGTGSIIFNDGGGDPILELNNTVSAVNGLAISAGATGNPAQITTGTGSEANIDIGFLTNGTGAVSVVAGSGNYEDNVTADDDIPNKKYVDDAIALTGGSGTLDSVTGTVDLTSATAQNIGAATGIPIAATILSVTLDVTTLSPSATTVTVGDATNGAASYMAAAENDPEIQDIYIADGRLLNGGAARQAQATVATPGASGAATCIITFRHA